ncbi:Mov34/MPN/PAD-1 family protein [Bradyrhizobium valentinum]|uniref:Mov34/MPN/PAD-1 family protein n=1 Tax=Bradyrhizobium valentinum TaxID=1518501 RepID=UPI0009E7DD73
MPAPSQMLRSRPVIVWLSSHVLRLMCRHARELSPLENGGILLGWRSGEYHIVVDLRGPGPRAIHGRQSFIPDHAWQVSEINRAFEASCGDLDYLGDWHSHPDGIAKMSDLDSATLLRIARRVNAPLMLIVAGSGADWSPQCWKGQLAGRDFGVDWSQRRRNSKSLTRPPPGLARAQSCRRACNDPGRARGQACGGSQAC